MSKMINSTIHMQGMLDSHNANHPNESQSARLREAFETILSDSNLNFVSFNLSIYYRERQFVNNCTN